MKVGFLAVAEATGAAQMAVNKLQGHIEAKITEIRTQKIVKAGTTKPSSKKASPTGDILDQLQKLKDLLDSEAITEAEFKSLKKKLMG